MAITAYTGLMGSGKTYEMVESVILPAVLLGRRVVTNVAGLNVEEIHAYLIEKKGGDPAKFGEIVRVANEDVERENFFPQEHQDPAKFIVQGGDLVVVDEVWRWWAAGAKIPAYQMAFFRMHRHFTHPVTGLTCDLVLVCQDVSDLDRKLKVVLETTYRMSKLKALGAPKRYRVDVFANYRTSKAPIRQLQKKYDPAIFALYASYSQSQAGGGQEVTVDGRTNVFKSPFFLVVLPAAFLLGGYGVYTAWQFFNPKPKAAAVADGKTDPKKPVPAKADKPAPKKNHLEELVSEKWRLVGFFGRSETDRLSIIEDEAGRVRFVRPVVASASGIGWAVALYPGADAELVTTWSGAPVKKGDSGRSAMTMPGVK